MQVSGSGEQEQRAGAVVPGSALSFQPHCFCSPTRWQWHWGHPAHDLPYGHLRVTNLCPPATPAMAHFTSLSITSISLLPLPCLIPWLSRDGHIWERSCAIVQALPCQVSPCTCCTGLCSGESWASSCCSQPPRHNQLLP